MDATAEELQAIRAGLKGLPVLAHHVAGDPVRPEQIFFPSGHYAALDPDGALVVGNRGVGKSFWASALAGTEAREAIAAHYGEPHSGWRLKDFDVRFGFSNQEAAGGALVGAAQLTDIDPSIPQEIVWRAVLVRAIAPVIQREIPTRFADLVEWVRTNPDEQQAWFRLADRRLVESKRRLLLLFDQLEQLANDWEWITSLTRGLLKTALAMKSYRSIRLKIFMRPDQFETPELFQFADASKIRGEAVRLEWTSADLYALVFFELNKDPEASAARDLIWDRIKQNLDRHLVLMTRLRLGEPSRIAPYWESPLAQQPLFEVIAGGFMGSGPKKGNPYTWIPTHLSDARGEVTPRIFLLALRTAALASMDPASLAITPTGIKEGIRAASEQRLHEIQEDYPWVSEALEPLRGLLVPAANQEIIGRWREVGTIDRILSRYSGVRAPLDLAVASIASKSKEEEAAALLELLQEIGVMDIRQNGKIDVPDIYRVQAGILRKGGVPPQRRRAGR